MSDAGFNPDVSKWFFEICDGENTAVMKDHFRTVTFSTPDPSGEGVTTEVLQPDPLERMPELVRAIRNDEEPYVGTRAGVVSTFLAEAVLRSAREGAKIAVDLPSSLTP